MQAKTQVDTAIAMERIDSLTNLVELVVTEQRIANEEQRKASAEANIEQRNTTKAINSLVVQMARKEEKDDALTKRVEVIETNQKKAYDNYVLNDKPVILRCKKQNEQKDSQFAMMKTTWFKLAAVALVCGMAVALGIEIPGVTK